MPYIGPTPGGSQGYKDASPASRYIPPAPPTPRPPVAADYPAMSISDVVGPGLNIQVEGQDSTFGKDVTTEIKRAPARERVSVGIPQSGPWYVVDKTTSRGHDIEGQTLGNIEETSVITTGIKTSSPQNIYLTDDIVTLKKTSPELYNTLINDGISAYERAIKTQEWEFYKNNIKLADGQYISNEDFYNLSPELQEIAQKEGFAALTDKIATMEAEYIASQGEIAHGAKVMPAYEVFQRKLEAGEIIKLPDGQYIEKVDLEKQPEGTQQILMAKGFAGLDEIAKIWVDTENPDKRYTQEEYDKIVADYTEKATKIVEADKLFTPEWYALGTPPSTRYKLTREGAQRQVVQLASFIAPVAKSALPEYTLSDISTSEWILSGINVALLATAFAPGAIMGSVAGRAIVTGMSTTGAGVIGFETARNWNDLTPAQKGMGVAGAMLYALPLTMTVARNIKVGSVKPIPTIAGEVVPWKGLSINQRPLLGKSGGKWVIGTRNLTIPEARLIMDGYKPETMLETRVFVNKNSLAKAGFNEIQIKYLTDTLKARNKFAGKKSPYLSKEAVMEPTQRIDADEVNIMLGHINKHNKNVKQVDMLYGSATIKGQLKPELRTWREVHDWDISTTMNEADTIKFTEDLLKSLNKSGKGKYRISSDHPTLIEKEIDGKWEHIADIHSHEAAPVSEVSVSEAASKLDYTGEFSYGRQVAEPAITIDYPGVGKLDIMSLSEAGVRKSDTILRVRQTPEGVAFRPPERGIAQPGVPKDAADFYVILYTYKGEKVAEEWLKSWAKAMGYTEKQLAGVLPKIRKAIIEVASETPSNLIGYRFTPSKAMPGTTRVQSPLITLHVPSSLSASVPKGSSIARTISTPINPYKLSPQLASQVSTALSSAVSTAKVPSYGKVSSTSISPKVSSSISYKKGIQPSVSSPSVISPSKGTKPSVSPGVKPPSPSEYPAPPSTSSVSPPEPISPYPSPPPKSPSPGKPSPSPYPLPPPVSPPVEPTPPTYKSAPPKIILITNSRGEKKYKLPPGSIAWAQGFIWKFIPPPWNQEKPYSLLYPPAGAKHVGEHSPAKTIQMIGQAGAKVPEKFSIDMGVVDIFVTDYGRKIRFSGKGEQTKVGMSTTKPTTGMSTGESGIMQVRPMPRIPRMPKRVVKQRQPKQFWVEPELHSIP